MDCKVVEMLRRKAEEEEEERERESSCDFTVFLELLEQLVCRYGEPLEGSRVG